MIRFYLNAKQVTSLVIPIVFGGYVYFNPGQLNGMIDSTLNMIMGAGKSYNVKELAKESLDKGYYKELEELQKSHEGYSKSIFDLNKTSSALTIAYFYKHKVKKEIDKRKNQNINNSTVGGNFGKLQKLQSQVDARNADIKNALEQKNNLYAKADMSDPDVAYIMNIINSRGLGELKVVKENSIVLSDINIDLFKLQAILHGTVPKVIINNRIFKKFDKIDGDIRISTIGKEKVLLKNKKESKWLYLNK